MSQGFTLIECLVALAILAIILVTGVHTVSNLVTDTQSNHLRQLAMWAADNEMASLYITKQYINNRDISKQVSLANVTLFLKESIVKTKNPLFSRIDISVSLNAKQLHSLYHVVGVITRY